MRDATRHEWILSRIVPVNSEASDVSKYRIADIGLDMLRHVAQSYLPAPVYRFQQIKRRASLFEEAGIVFVHVPKNAGTSISAAIYGRFVGHVWASDLDRWGGPRLRALPRFSVVRNPWDRCLSAYFFATTDRSSEKGRRLQKISRPERFRSPEFSSFDSFVTNWLAHQDLNRVDQVFRPQVQFLKNLEGKVEMDFIGRVEQLNEVADRLSGLLCRPVQIGHKNKTAKSSRNYRDYYSDSLSDLVGRIYAEDIETFKYEF